MLLRAILKKKHEMLILHFIKSNQRVLTLSLV